MSLFLLHLWLLPLILTAAIWSIYWKGMALWRAARLDQKKWFIALLIINTGGILEILYIYYFSEKKEENSRQHYICTGGCGGVSDKPGVCQAKDCSKHNHALEPCDCKDGKHYGRQEAKKNN